MFPKYENKMNKCTNGEEENENFYAQSERACDMGANSAVKIVLGETRKNIAKLQGNQVCIKHIMRTGNYE